MALDNLLVLVTLVIFGGAIAWVSIHSHKKSQKNTHDDT